MSNEIAATRYGRAMTRASGTATITQAFTVNLHLGTVLLLAACAKSSTYTFARAIWCAEASATRTTSTRAGGVAICAGFFFCVYYGAAGCTQRPEKGVQNPNRPHKCPWCHHIACEGRSKLDEFGEINDAVRIPVEESSDSGRQVGVELVVVEGDHVVHAQKIWAKVRLGSVRSAAAVGRGGKAPLTRTQAKWKVRKAR